jgi:hypothetical protein
MALSSSKYQREKEQQTAENNVYRAFLYLPIYMCRGKFLEGNLTHVCS